jgi:hypothetical protein
LIGFASLNELHLPKTSSQIRSLFPAEAIWSRPALDHSRFTCENATDERFFASNQCADTVASQRSRSACSLVLMLVHVARTSEL